MSRPPFRLHHIILLQAVMQSQTLTEAAQRLHISQPAVSKQLKQLQEDVGFALFERQGHRLLPTFEARAMLDQVNRVGASLNVLNHLVSDFRTARRGHIQIGCIPSAAELLLPPALKAAFGAQSHLLCTIETGNTAQVMEWVETQQVDLGVAMKVREGSPHAYQSLMPLRLECLMPADHPLARKRTVKIADLSPYPVIGLKLPDLVHSDAGSLALEDDLVTVHIRVDSSRLACRMVEAGLGVAVIESLSSVAYAGAALVRRPLAHPFRTELGIYRPSYRPRITAVEELSAELIRLAALRIR